MIPFACSLMLLGGLLVLVPMPTPIRVRAPRRRRPSHPAQAVASALGAGLLALVVTALPAAAVVAALAGAALPGALHRRRAHRRDRATAEAWPALIDDMTSALRAGSDLAQALQSAGHRAPEALQPAFTAFAREQARAASFDQALAAMGEECADPVFHQLRQSLVVARRVGGHDLTRVLRALSAFVRADLQVRGELAARQSWTVNAARLAVAAPWLVLGLLATRPATTQAYATATGALVLLGVAGLSAVAYAVMLRVARLDGVAR